ncbi:tripartite tricarboxylate transporter substrate binding protein [Cupriavidus sp. L7L]|nr:tripartite tricarboxylate transporter substrate binding protein [Cupriavidus sp. L7L]TDF64986.1 tripartite tricarboxylate transporter substrate binding protein [Cupriavidus sp. L7L]
MLTRRILRGLLSALLTIPAAGFAQDWPSGPVRVIVPFAAGSTPDLAARIISERLSVRLGKPLVVENKSGASGNIGTDAVAKAAPDGQTIGVSIAGPLAVNTLLYKKLPYDPAKDIEPITIAATQPAVLVVSHKLGVGSTKDFLALLKKNPSKFSFSSTGAGTISHLAMEAIAGRCNADPVHVPYPGSGAAVTAVIAGDVDFALLPAAAVMPHIKAGKLKGLAVASAKRSATLPELPTLAEAGLDDIQADAWIGFIVPAKTPPAIVTRLHKEIVQVLAEPAVHEKLKLQYMDVVGDSPSQFRAVMASDLARWKPIVQKHNIKLD